MEFWYQSDKNLLGKSSNIQPKKEEIFYQNPQGSLLSSLNTKINTSNSSNIDSNKLLNILTEEFLYCDDNLKLENYIGDLSSFDAEVLVTNEKIEQILNKIDVFLKRNGASDMFLIPNLLNLLLLVELFEWVQLIWLSNLRLFLWLPKSFLLWFLWLL